LRRRRSSEIGTRFRLAELSYIQSLPGNALDVRAGYLALGNDFAGSPILSSFQNSGFCAHPKSLLNDSGLSDYPIAKWAARVRVTLPADTYRATAGCSSASGRLLRLRRAPDRLGSVARAYSRCVLAVTSDHRQ
jgi:carbohydrate-selective porin OprB